MKRSPCRQPRKQLRCPHGKVRGDTCLGCATDRSTRDLGEAPDPGLGVELGCARHDLSFAEFRRIRKTLWGSALIARGSL